MKLLNVQRSDIESGVIIDRTALVEKGAIIGKNSKIGPYCIIGSGVKIGDNVEVKSHVVMEGRVTIGDNNVIYPFTVFSFPQTLKYKGEDSEIIIGNNNIIRQYVSIEHGTACDRMRTVIGDNNLIMVGVHIGHNVSIGNNVIITNYVNIAGHVEIENNVTIGGLSGIRQKVKIGKYAMIGGMCGVDKDVIPFGLISNKIAELKGLNLVGMRRNQFDRKLSLEANSIIQKFISNKKVNNKSISTGIFEMKQNHPDNEIILEIANFIENSREFIQ